MFLTCGLLDHNLVVLADPAKTAKLLAADLGLANAIGGKVAVWLFANRCLPAVL